MPGGDIVIEALRNCLRDEHHMCAAGKPRNEIELDARRYRAREVPVEEVDTLPTRHRPAHQHQCRPGGAERGIRNTVLARLRVPRDDCAMHLICLGNRETELRAVEIE